MAQGLSDETWRRLRQEARHGADEARQQGAEQLTREAMGTADLALLARVEKRLSALSEIWAVHQKPLTTRIPLVGPLLSWLGSRLVRFLLQHQVGFNSEVSRTLQEVHQLQRLRTTEQIDRTDDLFSRLDEMVLGLEARVRDLEKEVERLRQQVQQRP